ncbi:MAG: ATP-binding protein [Bacteroidales bacterium]|nr:ATP-binding protein [Bacteroidales bacterium]MDD4670886.1 ATP-binding protein [Bacteroidales bacterium]
MIDRTLENKINNRLFKGKCIIIVGPRQVGKTTLVKHIVKQTDVKSLFLNCDEPDVRQKLTLPTSTQLGVLVSNAELVVIDEAQRVENIGITLKLLIDNFPDKQVIVTGSSALDLSNSINEPLTGRKIEYVLFPFSEIEMIGHTSVLEEQRMLEQRLIYGCYPDVVNSPSDARIYLNNIVSSYMYKDIFAFQDVRKPEIIEQLLQALALQVGSECSFNELSKLMGISMITIGRYVDLLEKSYVVFHLRSFSRNVRNELKKSRKFYFYDNGVRNALISDFKPLALRTDAGALWENFLVSERLKRNQVTDFYGSSYFWRTTQQQEVDYLEDQDGVLSAFEFKWNTKRHASLTDTFKRNYPNHTFTVVNKDNYLDFCGFGVK